MNYRIDYLHGNAYGGAIPAWQMFRDADEAVHRFNDLQAAGVAACLSGRRDELAAWQPQFVTGPNAPRPPKGGA